MPSDISLLMQDMEAYWSVWEHWGVSGIPKYFECGGEWNKNSP